METHKYAPREIDSGSLARATKLPEGVDTDNIWASFDKSVFQIMMPAPKKTASKRVAIEAKR